MIDEEILKNWFFTEIFPLDAALTRFIRRNWRNETDVADLRQDIYARVYASARERLPLQAKPFLYITARNHLINCAKRAKIVSFEHVADLDSLGFAHDAITPDRQLTAREELYRAQEGLNRLPPRCRAVVMIRKIEGLSTRETSERLGAGVDTMEQPPEHAIRAPV